MKIFPKSRVKVAEGLHVRISNHFFYSDFGIRESGEMRYSGRRFVMSDTPGTGFIERESESHSYHVFVRELVAKQKPNYMRMLLGREPSFDRAIAEASKAMIQTDDRYKRDLLECYVNALTIARNEERMERIVRGIKDKMGHRSNKFMVSVMSHYKSKIRQLEHDMASVVWQVEDHCSEETYKAYLQMVEAFTRVASCRRIWFLDSANKKQSQDQVFFDLGIFDYIISKDYLPIMRHPDGTHYYFLPDAVIVARSNTDFDVLPLKNMTIVYQELAIEETNESMLGRLGDAASSIKIPECNLTFYFNHLHPIVNFIQAMDRLKATL